MTRLYTIAHWLRDRLPFLWQLIERVNALFFRLRYARRLRRVESEAMKMIAPMQMQRLSDISAEEMVAFFHSQPVSIYRRFTPHGFELPDVTALQRNASFLAYVLKRDGNIVGYFFLRSYFNGSCYFGRMVDYQYMSQGIGTLMNKVSFFISESLHMQSYQTIAADNIASIKSCEKAYRLQPISKIANGDTLYKNCKL